MYILSELYNFYAFTAVEKHNEYQNKIEFSSTSSTDSISTSLSLPSESLSYSYTWLKSAVDARVSCGTVASLTKLNTDTSETTERISEAAVGVCSTWSAGKKTLAVALGFASEYTAGGRVPALSLVVSLLTVL